MIESGEMDSLYSYFYLYNENVKKGQIQCYAEFDLLGI